MINNLRIRNDYRGRLTILIEAIMQLRALEYIVAVDETRNFGRAAKSCFVSQPTLSIQIKKMEDYLGVRLFERTNKAVHPTSIGVEIIALSKAILYLSDEIKEVSSKSV